MSRAVRVRVSGRVQGVFFRRYAAEQANRLGVTGWVSNEPDDSVLLHAEGTEDAVSAMVDWSRQGSPAADVQRVDVDDVEPVGATSFEVR